MVSPPKLKRVLHVSYPFDNGTISFNLYYQQLCTPASIYFIISFFAIILMAIQNMQNNRLYHLAGYTFSVANCWLIFIIKIIYILFWTWILNLICRDGHTGIAWFLILIPFILFFLVFFIILMSLRESHRNMICTV